MFNHAPNEVLKATVLKCLKKGTMLRSGRTTYLSARPRSRWSSSAACATLTDPSSTPATSVPQSEWVKLEEAFCGHNSAYRPTNGIPTLPQIRKARAEFERRFMQTAGKDCGVPGVLVATHVDRGKWSQKEDFQGCKFLMTASSDLFITQVLPTTIVDPGPQRFDVLPPKGNEERTRSRRCSSSALFME